MTQRLIPRFQTDSTLYVTLEAKGFLKPEVLDTLGKFGSILSGHPTIEVPGIEVNSGALGHGLPIGVGMAIAAKMDKQPWRTFVMMGDGEQGEGSYSPTSRRQDVWLVSLQGIPEIQLTIPIRGVGIAGGKLFLNNDERLYYLPLD